MKYSEFLEKFYLPENGGGLVGYKGRKKIAMFFFEYGLDDDYNIKIINPSDSTYEKWANGSRSPESSIWAEVLRSFNDSKLQKGLLNAINENNIRTVMGRFDIKLEVEEPPDKLMFAKAVVTQFHALAAGSGIADNIVPSEYRKPPELKGFGTYLREAKRNYMLMKLPGNEDCQMSSYFVCNNIGTSSAVFPHRIRGAYIEDATLQKIRKFDRRGEIKRAILIGACGYGKTLMFQHLFLEAAANVLETGMLPIFAELRDFSSRYDTLLDFLVESVQRFDLEFSKQKLVDLLEKGQAEILMDGLDEMNPEETNYFQRKLANFCHHYSNNQVVISSRQCKAISGIRNFTKLYIHPLDEDQSVKLIEKLLYGEENMTTAKQTILSFMNMNTGFVRRNGFVATNPMLLTIMVKHYEEINKLGRNKVRFYELMYNALIKEHDDDKESFDRFFHSVGSSDEFTDVFREFCSLAYMDGIFEFDHRSFEKYFKHLKSKDNLLNPSIFTLTNFHHDVCATACVMYEQESGIYYIDPGFQDYFFTEYYYQADTEATKEMGRALWDRKINSFRNIDALRMFYEIAPEKVETCILLPYLNNIFKGKDDVETFLKYMAYSYGTVSYSLFNQPLIDSLIKEKRAEFDFVPVQNFSKSIIMELLYSILGLPNTFVMGAMDENIQQDSSVTDFYTGYYDEVPPIEDSKQQQKVKLRAYKNEITRLDAVGNCSNHEHEPAPITDKSGRAVCLGFQFRIDPMSLKDNPEQMSLFTDLCQSCGVSKSYERLKKYYISILENQKVNEYR